MGDGRRGACGVKWGQKRCCFGWWAHDVVCWWLIVSHPVIVLPILVLLEGIFSISGWDGGHCGWEGQSRRWVGRERLLRSKCVTLVSEALSFLFLLTSSHSSFPPGVLIVMKINFIGFSTLVRWIICFLTKFLLPFFFKVHRSNLLSYFDWLSSG